MRASRPKAEIEQAFTYEVLDNLHMRRNEKGNSYAQHGEFIGVEIDTVKRRLKLTVKKLAKLKAGFVEMLHVQQSSPRDMSELHEFLLEHRSRTGIGISSEGGAELANVKRLLSFVFSHIDIMVALGHLFGRWSLAPLCTCG